jgi:hypothetical protein
MQRNLLTILTLSIFLISSISVTSGEIIEGPEDIIDITENNSFIKSKLESKRLPEQTPDVFTANLGQLDNDKVLFYTQNGMIWLGVRDQRLVVRVIIIQCRSLNHRSRFYTIA